MDDSRERCTENENSEALPLFPGLDVTSCDCQRDGLSDLSEDLFLKELVNSPPVQRLRRIGFLGAIDYVRHGTGRAPHRRRHTRFEHSVAVAELALLYARLARLSEQETRVLGAAALLHDIGHGPLSHTLEPVFDSHFGITHHFSGRDIRYGRSKLGDQIPNIARRYSVDLDEVEAMIEGVHESPHAFLFSSPINLDTIEGITRCQAFFSFRQAVPSARLIVAKIARGDCLPTKTLDAFWRLKRETYDLFIHCATGLLYDGLAQSYMIDKLSEFSPRDFLRDERQLRHHHGLLFCILSWAKHSRRRLRSRVARHLFDYEMFSRRRDFIIDKRIPLECPSDLQYRYTQVKRERKVALGDLVNLMD